MRLHRVQVCCPRGGEDEARRLYGGGYDVDRSEWDTFPGYRREHVWDGHGNRVELLA